jgi:Tol biopolymer transport system component
MRRGGLSRSGATSPFKPTLRAGDDFGVLRVAGPLFITALLGCGRINYDPVTALSGDDAQGPAIDMSDAAVPPSADADPLADADLAGPDAVACSAGFSAPVPLQIEGLEPDLFGPRLNLDGSTLFLSQTRGTNFRDEDIFAVQRGTDEPTRFDRPTLVAILVSDVFDGSAFPSADGLEIVFSTARMGGPGNRDLWHTRRASLADSWGPPVPITEIDSPNDDQNPSLTGDGLVIFFSSDREGTKGREDIYTAFRTSRTARFSPPVRMAELSSGNQDGAPFITADGLTIYFTSNRAGGKGGVDLWTARRPSRTVPFSPPVPLTAVNSPEQDDDPSISPDGRELFFASNRSDGKAYLIYRSTRCP